MNSPEFINFILDEFINNIDTDLYYDKYDNMTREQLYYYFKGKYDERNKKLEKQIEIIEDEDINIQDIKELEYVKDYEADGVDIKLNRDKINELIRAVTQLDKTKENKKYVKNKR